MGNAGWRRFPAATVAVALAIVAGVRTGAEETGGSKGPREAPPRKILVVAVTPEPSTRAAFESVIAGELSLRGAPAVASYGIFPDLPKERGPFEAKVVADGFDAVTVSRLVGRETKAEQKEATGIYEPEFAGQDVWGSYWYSYEQAFLPGYLEKETRIRVRTDFFRVSGKQGSLVWSGTSDLLDPATIAQGAREVGVSLVKALAKAKLL